MALKKVAIIDTCVLQYGVRRYSIEVAELFQNLSTKQSYGLVLSNYTTFEIFRGLEKSKIEVTNKLVKQFTTIGVDHDTLKVAAMLYTCYQEYESTKNISKGISDGDYIIAAQSFINKAVVVTSNGNDFPRPFFKELSRTKLINNRYKKEVTVHALEPDYSFFNKVANLCYSSVS